MQELTDKMVGTLLSEAEDIDIDGRVFTAGRPSLGKTLLLRRAIEKIKSYIVDEHRERTNALYTMAGLMQVATNEERADDLYRILAIMFSNTRHELLSTSRREEVRAYLRKHLQPEEACTLFLNLHSVEDTFKYQDELGITNELKRMERISKVKKDGGSVSFCGCSIWGNLIDRAAERYGWTLDYILWGVSLANLQMLMADQVKTVYLSEKERKQAHVSSDRRHINGNDKAAMADFAAKIKEQNNK